MRFKIHSFIFIFVACFLLFYCTPSKGGSQKETVFLGDELTQAQQKSFKDKIAELNGFYQAQNFNKIGQFYKEMGKVTAYDLQPIQGRGKIAAYFKHLYVDKKVRVLNFIAKVVYAQELEENTTVRKLLKEGIIRGKDIPDNVKLRDRVTHALHAIISVEFTDLGGKKYNEGFGSSWDGFHIDGCPIF